MNKNRVFETVITSTDRFDSFALPKDAKRKVRTAKVGAGVVVLPDNGADITDSEIVKALGLKDFEPEAKEGRTKYILRNNYDAATVFYLSLTESQKRLIDWLVYEVLLEDYTLECAGNVEFEEI